MQSLITVSQSISQRVKICLQQFDIILFILKSKSMGLLTSQLTIVETVLAVPACPSMYAQATRTTDGALKITANV